MEPPNPQKLTGYKPPGMLNIHNGGRPVRGAGRVNPLHPHLPCKPCRNYFMLFKHSDFLPLFCIRLQSSLRLFY